MPRPPCESQVDPDSVVVVMGGGASSSPKKLISAGIRRCKRLSNKERYIILPKRPDRAPQLAEDILTRRFSNLKYNEDDGTVFVRRRVEAERDSRFLREIVGIQLFI